jgi:hypothetical protein
MEYIKREEPKIHDFAGRLAGKAIGHGDVRPRLLLPGWCPNELVMRNIVHVEGEHNSLSQLWLMGRRLPIVHVNGHRIKIWKKPFVFRVFY